MKCKEGEDYNINVTEIHLWNKNDTPSGLLKYKTNSQRPDILHHVRGTAWPTSTTASTRFPWQQGEEALFGGWRTFDMFTLLSTRTWLNGRHDLPVPLRLMLQKLFSPNAEKLFQERGVSRIGLVRCEHDISDDGDKASGGGDQVVQIHSVEEPVRELGLFRYADDEGVVQDEISKVADKWEHPDDERPSESHATKAESLVEVMCPRLDLLQYLGVTLRKPRWQFSPTAFSLPSSWVSDFFVQGVAGFISSNMFLE